MDKAILHTPVLEWARLGPVRAVEAALLGYCIVVGNQVAEGPGKGSYVYGFVMTVLAAFGGGILNPVLLAHNDFYPFQMASDVVFPFLLVACVLGAMPKWRELCKV